MNFLIYISIAVFFFAVGWSFGVNNLSHVEDLTDNLEQATDYIEGLDSLKNLELSNELNNILIDEKALFNINLLQYIEQGNLDKAKNNLVNELTTYFINIKEDQLHVKDTEFSKDNIQKIHELSKKYESFKEIINSSKL